MSAFAWGVTAAYEEVSCGSAADPVPRYSGVISTTEEVVLTMTRTFSKESVNKLLLTNVCYMFHVTYIYTHTHKMISSISHSLYISRLNSAEDILRSFLSCIVLSRVFENLPSGDFTI